MNRSLESSEILKTSSYISGIVSQTEIKQNKTKLVFMGKINSQLNSISYTISKLDLWPPKKPLLNLHIKQCLVKILKQTKWQKKKRTKARMSLHSLGSSKLPTIKCQEKRIIVLSYYHIKHDSREVHKLLKELQCQRSHQSWLKLHGDSLRLNLWPPPAFL